MDIYLNHVSLYDFFGKTKTAMMMNTNINILKYGEFVFSTEFYFSTFFPYNYVYRELEKPFEIHIDVHQEYKSYL